MKATTLVGAIVVFFLIPRLPLFAGGVKGAVPKDDDLEGQLEIGNFSAGAYPVSIFLSPQLFSSVTPIPTPSPTLSPKPSPSATIYPSCIVSIGGHVKEVATSIPIEGATVEFCSMLFTVTETTDSEGFYTLNIISGSTDPIIPTEISCAADGYIGQSASEDLVCGSFHHINFILISESSPRPSARLTQTPSPLPTTSPKPSPSATQLPNCIMDIQAYVKDAITSVPIEGAEVVIHNSWFTETAYTGANGSYFLYIISDATYSIPSELFCSADGYVSQSVWKDLLCYHSNNTDFYLMPESSVRFSNCAGGDYDGDGTSDIAIFRPASGLWAVKGISRLYYGQAGDRPVSGDFNGDGTTETGIFRASGALWAIRGLTRFLFGESDDQEVPGDYDGDGTTDAGLFRDKGSLWMVRGVTRAYFGREEDIPVPGDYLGDGTSLMAIYRPGVGLWAVSALTKWYFGRKNDWPALGDYDGDGTAGIGVYRPQSGLWAVRGRSRVYYGRQGDWPVPADYAGSGTAAVGTFRGESGLWAIREISRVYFGKTGDIPLAR